jgi:hypothetical protein
MIVLLYTELLYLDCAAPFGSSADCPSFPTSALALDLVGTLDVGTTVVDFC